MSFLSYTNFKELTEAGDMHSITYEVMKLVNDSKEVASSKTQDVFYEKADKNRSVDTGSYDTSITMEEGGFKVSDLSLKGYEILSSYINNTSTNKAKAILIRLIYGGQLFNILEHLTIDRADWNQRITEFYIARERKYEETFNEFFNNHPKVKKIGIDKAELVSGQFSNIKSKYINQVTILDGVRPSEDEISRFSKDLEDLRVQNRADLSFSLDSLFELFGEPKNGVIVPMAKKTYQDNLKKATEELNELFNQI